MKKGLCLILVMVALLGCLTGCGQIDDPADTEPDTAKSALKVEEIMRAMAENRTADAAAMMHPGVLVAENIVDQISKYLDGRQIDTVEVEAFMEEMTSETAWEEQATYRIVLADGVKLRLFVRYLSNDAGEGFTSLAILDEE